MSQYVYDFLSNFKDFYNNINGATLTGAIDVIVVQQEDGTYHCSPFHVRFGKLGVLRSRAKIVDIEINGESVDIHMKLGESGEAFFVEECPEDDLSELPANMATSPLLLNEFLNDLSDKEVINSTNDDSIPLLKPRRNSIDLTKENEEHQKEFENQVFDYSQRRHTDNAMERRDISTTLKEFTTQKIRQEWAEHEEQFVSDIYSSPIENVVNVTEPMAQFKPIEPVTITKSINDTKDTIQQTTTSLPELAELNVVGEIKSKKKRRKKSQLKKKTAQRKSSSSSSISSTPSDQVEAYTENVSLSNVTVTNSDDSPNFETITTSSAPAILPSTQQQSTMQPSTSRPRREIADIHFFSDTEVTATQSPTGSRPTTPIQSDSEFEISHRDKGDQTDLMSSSSSWKWGELPTQGDDNQIATTKDEMQAQRNSMLTNIMSFMKHSKKMRKSSSEGIYLSELDRDDPAMAAKYVSPYYPETRPLNIQRQTAEQLKQEEDRESGNGTSLPHSPSSLEGPKSLDSDFDEGRSLNEKQGFVAISMCGGLESGGPTDEEFYRNMVQYSEVCKNPSLFASPLLVVRLNGKYYSWAAACPIVMTMITYGKPLTNDAVDQLMAANKPRTSDIDHQTSSSQPETKRSFWWWSRGANKQGMKRTESSLDDKDGITVDTVKDSINSPDENKEEPQFTIKNTSINSEDSELKSNNTSIEFATNEKYRKSLRLTSEQIESLNLKDGMNEIVFSVTTAYQGTTQCKCYLFKWRHDDKVVISDIDGTITKSDVLGQILPMFSKLDWAQIGVADLFTKIEENGYKLLYLSARAIGQSHITREYLRSVRQGNLKLPVGPLLLNPTSLISAFHREVIEKKPEQFKIACLSDIAALFPEKKPFYAGYGNRINDVWAYRAVGIPIERIFTINPKGELKHELTQTFQSTYCNMAYIVDQLYPPINNNEESNEFSNFNYWRDPVFELDIEPTGSSGKSSLGLVVSTVVGKTAGTGTIIATSTTSTINVSLANTATNLPTIPEYQNV